MTRLGQLVFGTSLTALSAIFVAGSAGAQTKQLNIMAGPGDSTSKAVVQDIADIAKECGLDPIVNETRGALDNLLAVRNNRYTQFGVIQADVMNFLRTFEAVDPKIAQTLRGIALAFPLYSEEIHLLVHPDINSIEELEGKRVAVGAENSGTFLTSTVILNLLSVKPAARLKLDPEASLDALIAGEVDALFFVDGVPSKIFDGKTVPADKVKLLSLDGPILSAVYESTTIEGGTYSFAPKETVVPKVGSVMITYDYRPRGNSYHRYNCQQIGDLTRLVHDNIADLATIGHPKWVEVDPNGTVPDLELSACAKRALEPEYKPACTQ